MPSLTPRIDNIESGRNVLINGNFDFWQRGTAATNASDTLALAYLADRWRTRTSGSGTFTVARSTDVPSFAQSGFYSTFALRLACTATATPAANDFHLLRQPIEGFNLATIAGRAGTLSFWIKASYSGSFCVAVNTDAGISYVMDYSIAAGEVNTWVKRNFYIDFSQAVNAFSFEAAAGCTVDFSLAIGSSRLATTKNTWFTSGTTVLGSSGQTNFLSSTANSILIAQVQLLPGFTSVGVPLDVAFSRTGNIQAELAACQRYYEKSYNLDVNPGTSTSTGMMSANAITTSSVLSPVQFKVSKRATSVISIFGRTGASGTVGSATTTGDVAGITLAGAGDSSNSGFITIDCTGTALVVGTNYRIHYTADAEL